MVKINEIIGGNKPNDLPQMWVHNLTVKKTTRAFKEGEFVKCFMTKMSDGRFSLMDADFSNTTRHYEVFSEEELHSSFDEQ